MSNNSGFNNSMFSYSKSIVGVNATITDALEALDNGGIRLAVVLDEERHLKGLVTDGDIRRALLAHKNFSSPVSDIMNSNPLTVPIGTPSSEILRLMREHSFLHIPIVDDQQRLVSIETFETLVESKIKNTTPIFLMAGGFGTRLRPLTNATPKVMLKVGSKPILENILLGFIEHGFSQFYISIYYLAHQIREHFGDGSKWGVSITYVEEDQPLGTGGALSLLPEHINEPIIMMNGDLLTKINFNSLLNFHNSKGALATMCVREYSMEVPYGVIESDELTITSIVEKPRQHFFVNAGVYVLSPEILRNSPKSIRKDMPDLFNELIADKKRVLMFPIHEYWLDIGRLGDFEQAQIDVLNIFQQ